MRRRTKNRKKKRKREEKEEIEEKQEEEEKEEAKEGEGQRREGRERRERIEGRERNSLKNVSDLFSENVATRKFRKKNFRVVKKFQKLVTDFPFSPLGNDSRNKCEGKMLLTISWGATWLSGIAGVAATICPEFETKQNWKFLL